MFLGIFPFLLSNLLTYYCSIPLSCNISFESFSFFLLSFFFLDFPGVSDSKVSAYIVGDLDSSLGWEDLLEKEMATHSSTIAWKIPWTEKPGRLQSMGSQRVRHDWMISLFFLTRGLSVLLIFLEKKNTLYFIDVFHFIFLVSISSLIFIIPFFLITLDSHCAYFSDSLSWQFSFFSWNMPYFLRCICICINFPHRTAFAASNRLGKLQFYFHFSRSIFWFLL